MAKNGKRNRLQREGLTFRELEEGDETGFVLQVIDKGSNPPKVTTIAQQPGHDTITAHSQHFLDEVIYPTFRGRRRFAPPQLTETERQGRIVSLLQASENPLAGVALQHLLSPWKVTES